MTEENQAPEEGTEEQTAYEQSGVDIDAGNQVVELIKHMVNPKWGRLNSFAGVMPLPTGYEKPMLVSSTDGIGTKMRILLGTKKFKNIGIDVVAAVVNDILCTGAKPLFFLDYVATGKIHPKVVSSIVQGIQVGCDYCDMVILGGETAEMPNTFVEEGLHEIAGFGVGIVERANLLDGTKVQEGDVLIGLPSDGVHANGFSLINRLAEEGKFKPEGEEPTEEDAKINQILIDELTRPTKLYFKQVNAVLDSAREYIHGIANITGGGLIENVPRILGHNIEGLGFEIDSKSWTPPEVFQVIKRAGEISDDEMWRVFNNGIGMVLCVSADGVNQVIAALEEVYEEPVIIGKVCSKDNTGEVEII